MAIQKKIEYVIGFKTDVASMNSLRSQLQQITEATSAPGGGALTKEMREAQVAAKGLFDIFNKNYNTGLEQLNVRGFNEDIQKSGMTLQDYGNKLSQFGNRGVAAFANVSSQILNTNMHVKDVNETLNRMANTFKNVISYQISTKVFNTVLNSVSQAYSYVKNLDSSLNDIRIVSGESAENMERFAIEANNAAKTLGSSTLDYTNAALIYYQQGLSGDDVTERTEATIKMANVLGDSASSVSSYMTAIWNNFADGTKTLEYFGDAITALGAHTAASSSEIAQGLQKFAAVSETVGLSYEYATAALATVVAQTRQSADTVGTAFKTIFARLEGLKQDGTTDDGTTLNKYSEALSNVGVQIKDTSGEMKSMDTILDELGAKWTNLSQAQKMALAQTVAGTRQYTQLISLMENYDTFKENVDVASGSEGTLDTQQATYLESIDAKLQKLKATWQSLYSDMIDEDLIKNAIDSMRNLVQVFDNFFASFGGGIPAIAALGTIVANIFNKQIAQGIFNAQNQLQAAKDKTQLLANMSEVLETEYGIIMNKAKQAGEAASEAGDKQTSAAQKVTNALDAEAKAQAKAASETDKAINVESKKQQIYDRSTESLKYYIQAIEKLSGTDGLSSEEAGIVAKDMALRDYYKQAMPYVQSGVLSGDAWDQFQNITAEAAEAQYQVARTRREYELTVEEASKELVIRQELQGSEKNNYTEEALRNEEKVNELIRERVTETEKVRQLKENLKRISKEDATIEEQTLKNTTEALGAISNNAMHRGALDPEDYALIEKYATNTEALQEASVADLQKLVDLTKKLNTESKEQIEILNGIAEKRRNAVVTENASRGKNQQVTAFLESTARLGNIEKTFSSITRMSSTIAMGWSMLSGTFRTINDETASLSDKLQQILMTIGMVGPMLMRNFKGSGIEKLFNINNTMKATSDMMNNSKEIGLLGAQLKLKEKINGQEIMSNDIQQARELGMEEYAIELEALYGEQYLGEKGLADLKRQQIVLESDITKTKEIISILDKQELWTEEQKLAIKELQNQGLTEEEAKEAVILAEKNSESVVMNKQLGILLGQIGLQKTKVALEAEEVTFLGVAKALMLDIGALLEKIVLFLATNPIGWIITGIAGIYGFIKLLDYVNTKESRALLELKEKTEGLQEEYSKLREEHEALVESFSAYDDAITAINKLTKGTQEWYDAIDNANAKVLELLTNYPELAQYLSVDENGLMTISQEGKDALLTSSREKTAATGLQLAESQKEQAAQQYTTDIESVRKKAFGNDIYDDELTRNARTKLLEDISAGSDIILGENYDKIKEEISKKYGIEIQEDTIKILQQSSNDLVKAQKQYEGSLKSATNVAQSTIQSYVADLYGVGYSNLSAEEQSQITKTVSGEIAYQAQNNTAEWQAATKDFNYENYLNEMNLTEDDLSEDDFKKEKEMYEEIYGYRKLMADYDKETFEEILDDYKEVIDNLNNIKDVQDIEANKKDDDLTDWEDSQINNDTVSSVLNGTSDGTISKGYYDKINDLLGEDYENSSSALKEYVKDNWEKAHAESAEAYYESLKENFENVKVANEDEIKEMLTFSPENYNSESAHSVLSSLFSNEEVDEEQLSSLNSSLEMYAKTSEAAAEKVALLNAMREKGLENTEEYKQLLEDVINNMDALAIKEEQEALSELRKEVKIDISKDSEEAVDDYFDALEEYIDKDYELTIDIKTNDKNLADTINAELDGIEDATGKIEEGFKVSTDNIDSLAEAFPGVLDGATVAADGMIQLDSEVANAAMAAAQADAEANAQAAADKLNADADLFDSKAESYENIAKIAAGVVNKDIEGSVAVADINKELDEIEGYNKELAKNQTIDNNAEVVSSVQTSGEESVSAVNEALSAMVANSSIAGKAIGKNISTGLKGKTEGFEDAIELNNYAAEQNNSAQNNSTIEEDRQANHNTQRKNYNNSNANIPEFKSAANLTSIAEWQAYSEEAAAQAKAFRENATKTRANALKILANVKQNKNALAGLGKSDSSGSGGSDSDPEEFEKIEDAIDKYDASIKKLESDLGLLQKRQENLSGGALIKNLQKQIDLNKKLLKQNRQKLKDTINLAKADKKELKKTYNIKFNKDGTMKNYESELQKAKDAYNSAVEAYDKLSDAEKKKQEENIQALKDYYDNLKALGEEYNTYISETIPELIETIEDEYVSGIQALIEEFSVEASIAMDFKEAKESWIDFMSTLGIYSKNGENILSLHIITDEEQNQATIASTVEKMQNSYANTLPALKNKVKNLQKGLKNAKTDEERKYFLEALREANTEYINELQENQQRAQEIAKAMVEQLDNISEAYNKQIEAYESVSDEINKDLKISQMLYGENNYKKNAEYYNRLYENQKSQLNMAQNSADYWLQEYNKYKDSVNAGEQELANTALEKYKEAIQKVEDIVTETLETLKAKLENDLAQIKEDAITALTGGLNFSELSSEWELYNSNNEIYFDAIIREYKIGDVERDYKDLLNSYDTDVNLQKKINAAMKEQLDYLREKENISQEDITLAEKRFNLLKAQIALEEAQNNKTNLRLRRDSQGNYVFAYAQDANKVESLQAEVEKAQEELYETSKKQFTESLTSSLSSLEKAFEYVDEIVKSQEFLSIESDEEKLKYLESMLEKYGYNITELVNKTRIASNDLRKILIEDFGMTEEQADNAISNIGGNLYSTLLNGADGAQILKDYFMAASDKVDEFKDNSTNVTSDIMDKGQVKTYLKDLLEEDAEVIGKINDMSTDLASSLKIYNDWASSVSKVTDEYIRLGNEVEKTIEKEEKAQLSEAKTAISKISLTSTLKSLRDAFSKAIEEITGSNASGVVDNVAMYDSGGYTGSWEENNNGKLAFLHEKEIVLNESDTSNLLAAVNLVREYADNVGYNLAKKFSMANMQLAGVGGDSTLLQDVHIDATFPNVSNAQEIEKAFNELVNDAVQYIDKNHR